LPSKFQFLLSLNNSINSNKGDRIPQFLPLNLPLSLPLNLPLIGAAANPFFQTASRIAAVAMKNSVLPVRF
jgi:hypothetical protein